MGLLSILFLIVNANAANVSSALPANITANITTSATASSTEISSGGQSTCQTSFSDYFNRTTEQRVTSRTFKDLSRFQNRRVVIVRTLQNLGDIRDLDSLSELLLLVHPQSDIVKKDSIKPSAEPQFLISGAHFKKIKGLSLEAKKIYEKNTVEGYTTLGLHHNPQNEALEFVIESFDKFDNYAVQRQRYAIQNDPQLQAKGSNVSDWSNSFGYSPTSLEVYFSTSKKDRLFQILPQDKVEKVSWSYGTGHIVIQFANDQASARTDKTLTLKLDPITFRLVGIEFSQIETAKSFGFKKPTETLLDMHLLAF